MEPTNLPPNHPRPEHAPTKPQVGTGDSAAQINDVSFPPTTTQARHFLQTATVLLPPPDGLDLKFPAGTRLSLDNPLTVIIGPNGTGKTGFLRLVSNALEFERHFRKTGTSKWIDRFDGRSQDRIKALISATMPPDPKDGSIRYLLRQCLELPCVDLGITRDQLHIYDESRRPGLFFREPPSDPITTNTIERLRTFFLSLNEPSDVNRWGYLALQTPEAPLCVREFAPPRPDFAWNGQEVEAGKYFQFAKNKPGSFNRGVSSPGQELIYQLGACLGEIEQIFSENKFVPYGKVVRDYIVVGGSNRLPAEPLAADGRILLLMDEPTAFLDPLNKSKFRHELFSLLKKHAPRLQVIMTTNDESLIAGNQVPTGVINLYETPAQSMSAEDERVVRLRS